MVNPDVVCLCGSTRFYEAFQQANYELTMAGKIVLSVGFYLHSSMQAHGRDVAFSPEQKEMLDELHLRKIDLADKILVLNVDGYIDESIYREMRYARGKGKTIWFYDSQAPIWIDQFRKDERTESVLILTVVPHGLMSGQQVRLKFTESALDGIWTVSVRSYHSFVLDGSIWNGDLTAEGLIVPGAIYASSVSE